MLLLALPGVSYVDKRLVEPSIGVHGFESRELEVASGGLDVKLFRDDIWVSTMTVLGNSKVLDFGRYKGGTWTD
jgi:hypothetical protein